MIVTKSSCRATTYHLKPLKLNKINVDDLNIAQDKLNEYLDELDKVINQ